MSIWDSSAKNCFVLTKPRSGSTFHKIPQLLPSEGGITMERWHVALVKVESIRGKCPRGQHPGEEWRIAQKTPGGICLGAFAALLPAIQTLQSGGTIHLPERAQRDKK